jgi:hypothetical protein
VLAETTRQGFYHDRAFSAIVERFKRVWAEIEAFPADVNDQLADSLGDVCLGGNSGFENDDVAIFGVDDRAYGDSHVVVLTTKRGWW